MVVISVTNNNIKEKATAAALGYFDGIHLGHLSVLNSALKKAKENNLLPVVLLFDIHPKKVTGKEVPPILTTDERKRFVLERMGFTVVPFDFKKAKDFSPAQFVEDVLIGELGVKSVSCGYDYRFGKNGKGTAKTLMEELSSKGVFVELCNEVTVGGETVSSTKIRQLLSEGKIKTANKMLGTPFCYDFVVEKGRQLGRMLGFPTINQCFPEGFVVPKFGVYASETKVDGVWYASVTNIGVKPTVGSEYILSETNIIGFDGDLYGRKTEVRLLEYLREEKKFSSLGELATAVKCDKKKAEIIYKEAEENG